MTLGERLKKARKEKKLTQQYMADCLGIAKSTYCGYESDFRKPDVLTVQRMAPILGVSGSYIIGDVEITSGASEILYISRPTGDESSDELRKQLHDYIDSLDDDELQAMSVMFKLRRD